MATTAVYADLDERIDISDCPTRNELRAEDGRRRAITALQMLKDGALTVVVGGRERLLTEVCYEGLRAYCHCGGGFKLHIEHVTPGFVPSLSSKRLIAMILEQLEEGQIHWPKCRERNMLLAYSHTLVTRQREGLLDLTAA